MLGSLTTLIVAVGALLAVANLSGATLRPSSSALARLELPALAGSLERAAAYAPNGAPIRLSDHGGLLVPQSKIAPGERVTLDVLVRRPRWIGWLLGSVRHERLVVRAPVARITRRWLTLAPGKSLRVTFERPVSAVVAAGAKSSPARRVGLRVVSFGPQAATGTIEIRAAARPWERAGPAGSVTWFPRSSEPVLVASPAESTKLTPTTDLRLTFSAPVAAVLGSARPTLDPAVAGTWTEPDGHTLLFKPSGIGFPLASTVQVALPRAVAISQPSGADTRPANSIAYEVAPGSPMRLQQLLAQAGYLPLGWHPAGADVARTARSEVAAAVDPPAGSFSWRYPNTPASLQSVWQTGRPNEITKGAVMMFEHEHGLAVDGIAGPQVWRKLLATAVQDQRHTAPYSYVYVHSQTPESLTLWSAGHVVLRSPGNTGIPSRPTASGTFAVFEHLPVGTMSGTNPDGSHYNDPGIRYISYFNGGDAIHEYPRASYGTPQSLGCVELPPAPAAKVWPYTPIGTLVTVEP